MIIKNKNIKQPAAVIFFENYVDEETGMSDIIWKDDLVANHGDVFNHNNGCDWARSSATIQQVLDIRRIKAYEMGLPGGSKIVAFQALGYKNENETQNHTIPAQVRKTMKNQPCTVLGVVAGNMEIDHKNGRYNQDEYADDDFQPLSKAVNDAKREHCKKCAATGCRFKATMLGYSVDYIEGDENSPTCRGCYWYDPKEFNKQISANFTKN